MPHPCFQLLEHNSKKTVHMSKSSIIAALAIAAGLLGSAVAEAGGKHRGKHHGGHHHHFRHHSFLYVAPVYAAPSYSDCSYAYVRWQQTGSFHWKKRYYSCKGWW